MNRSFQKLNQNKRAKEYGVQTDKEEFNTKT
jgi:hypothetical protein